jgi:hypothetical protein
VDTTFRIADKTRLEPGDLRMTPLAPFFIHPLRLNSLSDCVLAARSDCICFTALTGIQPFSARRRRASEIAEAARFTVNAPTPDWHTLKITMVDLTKVVPKIVLSSEPLPASYLGPPAGPRAGE